MSTSSPTYKAVQNFQLALRTERNVISKFRSVKTYIWFHIFWFHHHRISVKLTRFPISQQQLLK